MAGGLVFVKVGYGLSQYVARLNKSESNTFTDGFTKQLMIWQGCSKIQQSEKLGDEVGGWGWVWGWLVFARIKDWQSQSIIQKFSS